MSQEQRRSPQDQKNPSREAKPLENGDNLGGMFSPRFKSAAALAGWDEETLLFASLVVEDTPDRPPKHRKHFDFNIKTPPASSRRKRRAQRSPHPIPATVLDLEQDETPGKDIAKKKKENRTSANEVEENKLTQQTSSSSSSSSPSGSALPCIDKLREELSCAICLEICFEPSTTPCGHSFCRKCLRSAADKCGRKCPKCRQLISNGRSCTVNTVLWNTIRLLFPKEVEARKAAGALNVREAQRGTTPETAFYDSLRNRSTRTSEAPSRGTTSLRRRGVTRIQDEDEDAALARRLQREESWVVQNNNSSNQTPSSSSSRGRSRRRITSQDEDAALALTLQREEFMQAFRGSQGPSDTSVSMSSARANLRAMASRAVNLRIRARNRL